MAIHVLVNITDDVVELVLGWIETEMTEGLRADAAREAPILGRTPMGRWGQPGEVGELAIWLLSDNSSFVTGTVMPVDGGYAAM